MNPTVYTHLEVSLTQDPEVAYFHRVFISPAQARNTFQNS